MSDSAVGAAELPIHHGDFTCRACLSGTSRYIAPDGNTVELCPKCDAAKVEFLRANGRYVIFRIKTEDERLLESMGIRSDA